MSQSVRGQAGELLNPARLLKGASASPAARYFRGKQPRTLAQSGNGVPVPPQQPQQPTGGRFYQAQPGSYQAPPAQGLPGHYSPRAPPQQQPHPQAAPSPPPAQYQQQQQQYQPQQVFRYEQQPLEQQQQDPYQGVQQQPYPQQQQQQQPYVQQQMYAASPAEVQRVNPVQQFINKVNLRGMVENPSLAGRQCTAILRVPYKTKPGSQGMPLEAWDEWAPQLATLAGQEVFVVGSLRVTPDGQLTVTTRALKLVDVNAPTEAGGFAGAHASARQPNESREPREPRMSRHDLHKQHYDARKSLQELEAVYGNKALEDLLLFARDSSAPLHWNRLAAELGLAADESDTRLSLMELLELVQQYLASFEDLQHSSPPGVAPQQPPRTMTGLLKTRPLAEYAAVTSSEVNPLLQAFKAERGPNAFFNALRLAVAAHELKVHL